MLKVAIDTNVIVSGLTMSAGNPHEILEAWRRGDIVLLVSTAIVNEVVNVLGRPFFRDKRHITVEDIDRIERVLRTDALVVSPEAHLHVVENDPDDDRILECALEGEADYVASGDRHLLALKRYRSIPIVTARELVAIVRSQQAEGRRNT